MLLRTNYYVATEILFFPFPLQLESDSDYSEFFYVIFYTHWYY